jgi:hypothetical protein
MTRVFAMPSFVRIAVRIGPEALSPNDRHLWLDVGGHGVIEKVSQLGRDVGEGAEIREELRDLGIIERRQVDHGPSYEDFLTYEWRERFEAVLTMLDLSRGHGWKEAR